MGAARSSEEAPAVEATDTNSPSPMQPPHVKVIVSPATEPAHAPTTPPKLPGGHDAGLSPSSGLPPRGPTRTSSAPPASLTARPSSASSSSGSHRSRAPRHHHLRPSSSSASGLDAHGAAVSPVSSTTSRSLFNSSLPTIAVCTNCRMMAPTLPQPAHCSLPGTSFCSKECRASWSMRVGLEEAAGTDGEMPSAALIAAALERDSKLRPPAGSNSSASLGAAAPDSYVENRHEQIRRRGSSASFIAHESPRSSNARSTNSGTRGAYVCPAMPSHPTTPRLQPTAQPHASKQSGGSVTCPSDAAPHPDSSLLYSPLSASSMCVEEFDEELDTSYPSPPVRIPQAKPITKLKPFALPPQA